MIRSIFAPFYVHVHVLVDQSTIYNRNVTDLQLHKTALKK